jgi:hypothetical protein
MSGGMGSEVGGQFRGAVEIVNECGAAEMGEKGGRILAGALAERGIVEGEIGMGGEFAA